MNIEAKQQEIENTEYQDMRIWDIQTRYFGDEVIIFVENNDKTCWEIVFSSCYTVNYQTDANMRRIDKVESMRGGQLGYYGQDMLLEPYSEDNDFVRCVIDLSIMTMEIVCKNIEVNELDMKNVSFFWNDANN